MSALQLTFLTNCPGSSFDAYAQLETSLLCGTFPHMGSLKAVKSFTLAASASSNIEKVQKIETLFLLTVVFGECGCKQIDLKAPF